jgi:hypothetical protein
MPRRARVTPGVFSLLCPEPDSGRVAARAPRRVGTAHGRSAHRRSAEWRYDSATSLPRHARMFHVRATAWVPPGSRGQCPPYVDFQMVLRIVKGTRNVKNRSTKKSKKEKNCVIIGVIVPKRNLHNYY